MPAVEDPTTHRLVSVRRHGGERTLVVLAREHRIAYLRIGAAAAPFVEAALSRRVVANRVAEAHLSPPSLTLRPWRTERRGFAAGLRRLAARYGALVFADVADCYATI